MDNPLTIDDINKIEEKLDNSNITTEQYEEWLNNEVTQHWLNKIKVLEARYTWQMKTHPGNVVGVSPTLDNVLGKVQACNGILEMGFEEKKAYEH